MTASSPQPRRGRTFGLFRIIAPILTVLAFVLSVVAPDPASALAALGQSLMMLAITFYVFRLKGRPVTQRPPVHFTSESRIYAGMMTFGGAIWVASFAGIPGALTVVAASMTLLFWMRSTSGRAWRNGLVQGF